MSDTTSTPSTWKNLSCKEKLPFVLFGIGAKLSLRSDGTINRRIISYFDIKTSPSSKPVEGVITSDVVLDASRNLFFRLYVPQSPSTETTAPVIFFFHGGGYVWTSANSYAINKYCRRLSREFSAVIISINYRLSPEHRYPSQVEDGFDVLKFVNENPNFEGFPANADLKHCFLMGDSAGGNLAHQVAIRVCEAAEFSNLRFIGLIALQPFLGGEERTESEIELVGAPFISMEATDWLWRSFLPEGSNRDHPTVNIFGPNSRDISEMKFPATMVVVGGFDPMKDW